MKQPLLEYPTSGDIRDYCTNMYQPLICEQFEVCNRDSTAPNRHPKDSVAVRGVRVNCELTHRQMMGVRSRRQKMGAGDMACFVVAIWHCSLELRPTWTGQIMVFSLRL